MRTYQKIDKSTPKDGAFYINFFDQLLGQDFQLEEVETDGDIIVNEYYNPLYNVVESFPIDKTKIYLIGENLEFRPNELLKYTLKILPFFKIKATWLPAVFIKITRWLTEWYYARITHKNITQIYKGKNVLVIQTNVTTKPNTITLPCFVSALYKRISYFLEPRKLLVALSKKRFCCLMVSNLGAQSIERIKFMEALSKYKQVDCYGRTPFNNMKHKSDAPTPPKFWWENIPFMSQYKFIICFENSFADEYITEKLANAFLAGSIPIYRGAPNVGEYFNTEAFIEYGDFGCSYDAMLKKVIELDQDDNLYEQHLKQPIFRDNKIPTAITDKLKQTKEAIGELIRR